MLTLGLRRSLSGLGLVGVLYFFYRLTSVLCICPGYGIALGVCSAVAVVFGPTMLRIVGTILLVLSIFTTIDMFKAKAAQDAAANLQAIAVALREYQRLNGRIPTNGEGLRVLVEASSPTNANWRQVMTALPNDPWGRAYQYTVSKSSPRGYDIFSLGADPKKGQDDIHLE